MTELTRRRTARSARGLVAMLLSIAILHVAGCRGPATPGDQGNAATPSVGGADRLPGPVPAGVQYRAAAPSAPTAPDFGGTLLDGTPVRSHDLWARRPVVLVFFSSWCTRCAERQKGHNAVYEEFGDRIAVLGIAGSDSRADVVSFLEQHDVDYPVILDEGRIWRSYAVREPPAVALVSKGGHLLRGWPGGVSPEELSDAIDAQLLARP